MKYKSKKIVFIFFIILSTIIFLIGLLSLTKNLNKKKNCTEPVIATCTKTIKSSGLKHNRNFYRRTYRHVFSYEYNNKNYEIKYGIGYRDKNKFEVGKEYTIYVNPNSPSKFIIEGHENDIDTFAIAAPIVGATMVILFSTIYIIIKKKYKED